MIYSCTFAKERRVVKQAVRMGYTSREEIAKALGLGYMVGGALDVSGGTEKQLVVLLKANRRRGGGR
ncbi:hypothetical protein LCGC14_1253200 [marine sediment metagenome]|uniref:Uncharacterized protein n=1 Tax=marine sediment metagenome TaxID=412755 RepID=A0A0F9LP38_9ZZZZ